MAKVFFALNNFGVAMAGMNNSLAVLKRNESKYITTALTGAVRFMLVRILNNFCRDGFSFTGSTIKNITGPYF